MSEDFLHFIWQYQLLNHSELKTVTGEVVKVLHQGTHNKNSGPDFSLAKINISNTTWVGNIEIHVRTSDWFKHHHEKDPKYDNIILHVVFENDVVDDVSNKMNFPLVELKNIISPQLLPKYKSILLHKGKIACEKMIGDIDIFRFKTGLNRLAFERLATKSEKVIEQLKYNNDSWEETMYQLVARSFGLKVNADAFEKLATSIPLKIIGKHKNNLLQIEALLFGQAGFLNENINDEYGVALQKEYKFLAAKYSLKPMQQHEWHFLRLRPAAFPTIRIALFAMLLHNSVHLFSKTKEQINYQSFQKLFSTKTSAYWETHYRFDTISEKRNKTLGKDAVLLIVLNSIIPVLFAYGLFTDNENIREQVLQVLETLPPEKNNIIKEWQELKYAAENALESQALIQLKNEYCSKKQCLNCHVGTYLLKRK
jgi:hypothetical protein